MLPFFIRLPWLHVNGITFWFVVFYKGELRESLKRHETIHYKQYNEMWVLGFLLVYLLDFLKTFQKSHDYDLAYRSIRFEQEAYEHQNNETYLETRESYAWRSYTVTQPPETPS